MFKVLTEDQIPYADQAGRLFNLTGGQLDNNGLQRVVPFLGAGVSRGGWRGKCSMVATGLRPWRARHEPTGIRFGDFGDGVGAHARR